jgi:hypothetical protein
MRKRLRGLLDELGETMLKLRLATRRAPLFDSVVMLVAVPSCREQLPNSNHSQHFLLCFIHRKVLDCLCHLRTLLPPTLLLL